MLSYGSRKPLALENEGKGFSHLTSCPAVSHLGKECSSFASSTGSRFFLAKR